MTVEDVFSLARSYNDAKQQLEAKQPYHLNVIDELYINENGNSRILAKLFQYKSENQRYEMLESFVRYVNETVHKEEFGNIKVNHPEITQEKERIDIWVREKDQYAIIFENKIYNAADQDAQLCRYIEKTIEYGFKEDQVFVIYLSQNGVEPNDQSWGGYKDAFQCRYANISYRTHILPWLKEQVLPNVRIKEAALRSALEQYIDYLEGIFDLRTQNKAIIMELEEMIVKELNLNQFENGFDKVKVLQDKIEEINELNNQLTNLKSKYYKEAREKRLAPYIRKWKEEISKLYPHFEESKAGGHVGLLVTYREDRVNVRISEDDDRRMYCQIDKYGHEDRELSHEVMDTVHSILTYHSGNISVWKYFDINDFDGVFNCFKEVMDLLKQ